MQKFKFEVTHQSKKSKARVGRIITPHGTIKTPGFVPVATNASVKAVDTILLDELGIGLVFCNTYHLMIQPGASIVEEGGGLHKFMSRNGPIITDSGGFQVFSMAYGGVANELKSRGSKISSNNVVKVTEEGIQFRSYKDGSRILLTPEISVDVQKKLGADIILPLDELLPYHAPQEYLLKSLERTHRWEERSLSEHMRNKNNQAMYGIIHGGIDPILRQQSCEKLLSMPFDGLAIGGSIGKNRNEMKIMLTNLSHHLNPALPVHLLGVGDAESIGLAVTIGVDTFDSSHPTRCARHGLLFTNKGPIRVKSSSNRANFLPPDPMCRCHTCQNYSLAYLHHLFKSGELLAYQLASIHNLTYMVDMMESMRKKILNDDI